MAKNPPENCETTHLQQVYSFFSLFRKAWSHRDISDSYVNIKSGIKSDFELWFAFLKAIVYLFFWSLLYFAQAEA